MANIGISNFRSNDVLPGALLNFSALLGWDPNLKENPHLHKKGSMTMDEMKQNVGPVLQPHMRLALH